ncbi:MAG: hypothetical protein EBY62_08435, partial [Cellvibrionales bacterium]|nr:hypothetical protein [Cellvibrionales bacterium]
NLHGDLTVDQNVHIKGDLRVDGNAWLSAGVDGTINVGDSVDDNVVFRADVSSNIMPSENMTYDLGSEQTHWMNMYTHNLWAHGDITVVGEQTVNDLNVTGTTTLSGKGPDGPGLIITGTPTGVFDQGELGFMSRESDYIMPDVDITGDVALHGSLSADEAIIYSLTASRFRAEYQRLVVNDGDVEIHDGSLIQRGGDMRVQGMITHIDDENTYLEFQQDQLSIVCHDVRMMQFSEYPSADDVIIVGDTGNAVDLRVQNPTDSNTLYIDGDTARIGIGTNTPETRLHVATGQVQLAPGSQGGALMLPAGDTATQVDKKGSIRWNDEVNRYEGYNDAIGTWMGFGTLGDTDGDTYIDWDAEGANYPDSDRMSMYTAGCSAMTIHPDQTVVFAGDIQFDNVTVYDSQSVTGPLTATSEFLYLKVNGKDRAIRLWSTPQDTRDDLETIHGESIVRIDESCAHGAGGSLPFQTISAVDVLNNPPTQGLAQDSDGDYIIDALDIDDDGDGVLDYMDADHESNAGAIDLDNDGELSQDEFAQAMSRGPSGMAGEVVGGEYIPTVDEMEEMAEDLGMELDELPGYDPRRHQRLSPEERQAQLASGQFDGDAKLRELVAMNIYPNVRTLSGMKKKIAAEIDPIVQMYAT